MALIGRLYASVNDRFREFEPDMRISASNPSCNGLRLVPNALCQEAIMDDAVKALVTDPIFQQRLAKHLVLQCFRNSVLEDLHAGKVPDSRSGDHTDVVVRTPFGEIPWNELSRFNNAEMETLMVDVVDRTYRFIQELFDDKRGGELVLRLAAEDPVPQWRNPK